MFVCQPGSWYERGALIAGRWSPGAHAFTISAVMMRLLHMVIPSLFHPACQKTNEQPPDARHMPVEQYAAAALRILQSRRGVRASAALIDYRIYKYIGRK